MRPFETLPPTETLEIENGLSLVPRVKLNLRIHPALPSVSAPIDEWQLKRALIDFLKSSLSVSVTIPEEDLQIKRLKDLKKRKRDEPVAHGALFIRDLGFLSSRKKSEEIEEDNVKELEKNVEIPVSDDFERMKKDWEELYAFGNRGYLRGGRQEPDTIVLRGVPSRWSAEPRVSSKPSMLFEKYRDCYNVLKVLCGRSLKKCRSHCTGPHETALDHWKGIDVMQKTILFCSYFASMDLQGSRLSADYEVVWDKDGFFRNSRSQNQDKSSKMQEPAAERYRSEAPRREPRVSQLTSSDTEEI
ncbi:hypothetical protein V6N12_040652 [Hibiscus sabdariffa]|uniref:Uncharacterized protein n=1 Tax=Hibiscus sabdariffa TaxID=183260 RepID=A0ABR2E4A7_9ROSI